MEKRAIFRASLKLIREGKFHATSMAEIGYHANVSGSTVEVFFESREKLLAELAEYIFDNISSIVLASDKLKDLPKRRFFHLWKQLFDFYASQPDVIFFIDQFGNNPTVVTDAQESYKKCNQALIKFFAEDHSCFGDNEFQLDSEAFAFLFHENVKSAVRLEKALGKIDEHAIAMWLWKGIDERDVMAA